MAPKKSSVVLNVERFISDVEQRPAIWNRNFHCNKAFLEQMWDELANNHNLPKTVLKAKWKGLRDNFRVEYKRIPRSENGVFLVDPSAFESKWTYYNSLLFLTEHMRHRLPKNERDNHDPNGSHTSRQVTHSHSQSEDYETTVVEPDLTNGLIRRFHDSDEEFDEDDTEDDVDDEDANKPSTSSDRKMITSSPERKMTASLSERKMITSSPERKMTTSSSESCPDINNHVTTTSSTVTNGHTNYFKLELGFFPIIKQETKAVLTKDVKQNAQNKSAIKNANDALAQNSFSLSALNTNANSISNKATSVNKTMTSDERTSSIEQKRRASLSPTFLLASSVRELLSAAKNATTNKKTIENKTTSNMNIVSSTASSAATSNCSMASRNAMLLSSSSSSSSSSPPSSLLLPSAMINTSNALSSSLSSSSSSLLIPTSLTAANQSNSFNNNLRLSKKRSVSPSLHFNKDQSTSMASNLLLNLKDHNQRNTDDYLSLTNFNNRLLNSAINNNYTDPQLILRKHLLSCANGNGSIMSELASALSPVQSQLIPNAHDLKLKRLRTSDNYSRTVPSININNNNNNITTKLAKTQTTVTITNTTTTITTTSNSISNNHNIKGINVSLPTATTTNTNINGCRNAITLPEDDDYHYLLSLYPYMKQLTAAQKLRTRTRFQKIIFKELYKDDIEQNK